MHYFSLKMWLGFVHDKHKSPSLSKLMFYVLNCPQKWNSHQWAADAKQWFLTLRSCSMYSFCGSAIIKAILSFLVSPFQLFMMKIPKRIWHFILQIFQHFWQQQNINLIRKNGKRLLVLICHFAAILTFALRSVLFWNIEHGWLQFHSELPHNLSVLLHSRYRTLKFSSHWYKLHFPVSLACCK